jgi:hypothetical protein
MQKVAALDAAGMLVQRAGGYAEYAGQLFNAQKLSHLNSSMNANVIQHSPCQTHQGVSRIILPVFACLSSFYQQNQYVTSSGRVQAWVTEPMMSLAGLIMGCPLRIL